MDWLRIACQPSIVRRALLTAAIVGTILTVINHYAQLMAGDVSLATAAQILLTYGVPFLVSTASSVATVQREARRTSDQRQALERDAAAAINLPDQNPNPVLRTTLDGRVIYANAASTPVAEAIGASMGKALPAATLRDLLAAASAEPRRSIEVPSGWQTYALLPVLAPELGVLNLYGTEITGNKVVERFPDRNPNPVMRTSADGTLIYANPASAPVVASLGLATGEALPAEVRAAVHAALEHGADKPAELRGGGRTFAFRPVESPEFGFVNLYGTDVTAARALDKFPDQNPNPVMRVSQEGRLAYANPASAPCRHALGIEVGDPLPLDFLERVRAASGRDAPNILVVEDDGRIFELLVVAVYEFDFINLYGTEVTAARQVEQAHRENERLLLNILPAAIAERLRHGETLIADRFDAVTVLFADVVGFTEWSARLSAGEVVHALNDLFSIFDGLADRFGLEKIKTIGDAYMVVGGLAEGGDDQAEQVAAMGLEMIERVAGFSSASGDALRIRVGMHVGPAAAGVIGIKKFIYDVWGDTVNTASRMESLATPGRVLVSDTTYERLRQVFELESRGTLDVKGKGAMQTWFLVGRRGSSS